MRILAHRGDWQGDRSRHNTPEAVRSAFEHGWGIETDLRDQHGSVVISHDPADERAWPLRDLLRLHAEYAGSLPLALNVKADGLAAATNADLASFRTTGAFVFDMSVPDQFAWHAGAVPVYARLSDVEPRPVLLERCDGLWVDGMEKDGWWEDSTLEQYLAAGSRLAIVSSELHRRNHLPVWNRLRDSGYHRRDDVLLCTDYPREAEDFFS